MSLLSVLFDRLIDAATMSFVLLALGSVGVLCCRQPVRRMRIILLTLAGCLLAPLVNVLPGVPHWSVPRFQLEGDERNGKHDERVSQSDERLVSVASRESISNDAQSSTTLMEQAPALSVSDVQSSAPEPEHAVVNIAGGDPRRHLSEFPADPIADVNAESDGTVHKGAPAAPLKENAPATNSSQSTTADPQSTAGPFSPQSSPGAPGFDPRSSIFAAYIAGLIALSFWWLIGLIGLLRVLAVARPAPAAYRRLLRDIAGPAADRVHLLVSPRTAQPFTFAWRRPVIVLPPEKDEDGGSKIEDRCSDAETTPKSGIDSLSSILHPLPARRDSIRFALAHEWSHIARGDAWVWSFSGLVRLVYYYQPLCWLLRRQLRLCQDFLADSDAARQSSPTEYAEFLATRALGRPLGLGLGITAGKSDLYRRVSMLVTRQRPLETRCPAWWSAVVGALALSLIVVAATFGGRTETRAAPSEVAAVENSAEPITTRDETTVEGTAPASTIEVATVDPTVQERETIVAHLLARPKLPKFIRVRSTGKLVDGPSPEPLEIHQTEEVVGDGNWRVQTTELRSKNNGGRSKVTTELFHAGEVKSVVEEKRPDGTLVRRPFKPRKPTKADIEKGASLPHCLNAQLFTYLRKFIEENADKIRVGELTTVNELDSRVVEWDVMEERDIRKIFVAADRDKFKGGGTLRLLVVPRWNYAVTRMEHIDRSGKPQATIDTFRFEERWPGVFIPREIRVRLEGVDMVQATIDSIEELDPATAEKLFTLEVESESSLSAAQAQADEKPAQDAAAAVKKENSESRLPPVAPAIPPEKIVEKKTAESKSVGTKPFDPADAEKQKIIDGLLARERGIASGVIGYTEVQRQDSHPDKPTELQVECVFSGPSSFTRVTLNPGNPTATQQVSSVSHKGYFVSLRPVGKAHKLTFYSADQIAGRPWDSPLPRILGLPVEFSRVSAADLRLVGTETIQGIETQLVEYPASEGDALAGRLSSADAKPAKTVRLNVAPEFGYAIVHMTRLDQFGLASDIYDYSDFKEVAPGIHIPFKALIRTQGRSSDIRVLKLSEWNRPIAESRFVLRLPAGTQVEDLRPHWNDQFPSVSATAEFDKEAYPLRKFTLLAEEPSGLPSTVLAEMDRDLVSPEEWVKIRREAEFRERNPTKQGAFVVGFTLKKETGAILPEEIRSTKETPQLSAPLDLPGGKTPATRTSAPVTAAVIEKSMLRFGGKAFFVWKQTLLHDLDPETRVVALSAIGAFAATPYAEEIVSTIREVLKSHPHDPDPVSGEDVVATSAFRVLGRVGAPAVPLLEEQSANDEVTNRRLAMTELTRLAEKTPAVVPALLRATKHEDSSLRERALFALVKSHPKAPGVAEAVRNRFDDPDVTRFELQLMEVLLTSRESTIEIPTEALLRILRSRFAPARPFAAALLLSPGPAKEEVAEEIKKALLETPLSNRSTFVSLIEKRQTIDAAAAVPILIDLLEWGRYISTADGARIGPFEEDQGTAMERKIIEILARLPMDGPARAALPILVKSADGKLPNTSRAFRLAAIQSLGKAGPAAKEALPMLERLLDKRGPRSGDGDDEPRGKLALAEWQAAIESAIQRIEGKQDTRD